MAHLKCGNIIRAPTNGSYSKKYSNTNIYSLLDDNLGDMDIVDTRSLTTQTNSTKQKQIVEELPTKITGTYNENYNILYIDGIIRKKLEHEKYSHLTSLKNRLSNLNNMKMQSQTWLMRERTMDNIKRVEFEIREIESGQRLLQYNQKVSHLITEYKKYGGIVKNVVFGNEEEAYKSITDDVRKRLAIIDEYLDIASEYITLDIIKINNIPNDICIGCGTSLAKVATTDDGTIRCPNGECQIEHRSIIMTKSAKDASRINTNNNNDDESIENFRKAFARYQGLQNKPDDKLYKDLDDYFIRCGRPIGDDIKLLPLNNRGRRGDTNHKMLLSALSETGHSEYYEDVNLIGHEYWGWELPNVAHLKEQIERDYIETQKAYYQIPKDERLRNSSLGTQYRLWRHLQLRGHVCYMDEFKIAENNDSIRIHHKLWRQMCDGCHNPDIYYID